MNSLGVERFHVYLLGHSFTLNTDHQPLTSIIHLQKSILAVTAVQLKHYALFLAGYDYRNTKVHSNADGLSRRLPLEFDAVQSTASHHGQHQARNTEEILSWLKSMKGPVKDGHSTTMILNSTHSLCIEMRSHYSQAA